MLHLVTGLPPKWHRQDSKRASGHSTIYSPEMLHVVTGLPPKQCQIKEDSPHHQNPPSLNLARKIFANPSSMQNRASKEVQSSYRKTWRWSGGNWWKPSYEKNSIKRVWTRDGILMNFICLIYDVFLRYITYWKTANGWCKLLVLKWNKMKLPITCIIDYYCNIPYLYLHVLQVKWRRGPIRARSVTVWQTWRVINVRYYYYYHSVKNLASSFFQKSWLQ